LPYPCAFPVSWLLQRFLFRFQLLLDFFLLLPDLGLEPFFFRGGPLLHHFIEEYIDLGVGECAFDSNRNI